MTKHVFLSAVLITGLCAVSPSAQAGEVRVGVMAHDVEIAGLGGVREKERSESVTGQYIFDKELFWGVRPFVYGSANLAGNTSHGGFGVNFKRNFWSNYYVDLDTGLSAHNGAIRVPNPADAAADLNGSTAAEIRAEVARRFERKNSEIEFGSSVLFRNAIAIGYDINATYSVDIVYEHLSHGQILGGPENEGLDSVGVRLISRF